MNYEACNTKKILINSYAFPPQNIVGATRPYKLCKYLPRHGWQPYVLARTVRDKAPVDDKTRLDAANPTKVYRCPDVEPYGWNDKSLPMRLIWSLLSKFVLHPDHQILWNIPVLFKAVYLVLKENIDVVFCTMPPYSSFIGAALAAKITKRPFVADLRDLWTLHEYFDQRFEHSPFLVRYENFLERVMIRLASMVILNTPLAKEKMAQKYPEYKKKFYVITNGYDAEEFKDIPAMKFNKFTIMHAGGFYLDRNPMVLIKGLGSWMKKDKNLKNRIQIILAGRGSNNYQEQTKAYGVDDLITYMDQLPKELLFQYTKGADLLLLFLGFRPQSDYVIPAKLYEYMAVFKPVLGFVPQGGQAQKIIEALGLGETISSDDSEDVEVILKRYLEGYEKGKVSNLDSQQLISQFEYQNLTERISTLLDSLVH